jgi:hypothetical protein
MKWIKYGFCIRLIERINKNAKHETTKDFWKEAKPNAPENVIKQ